MGRAVEWMQALRAVSGEALSSVRAPMATADLSSADNVTTAKHARRRPARFWVPHREDTRAPLVDSVVLAGMALARGNAVTRLSRGPVGQAGRWIPGLVERDGSGQFPLSRIGDKEVTDLAPRLCAPDRPHTAMGCQPYSSTWVPHRTPGRIAPATCNRYLWAGGLV